MARGVTFEVQGVEYVLHLGTNAMARFEDLNRAAGAVNRETGEPENVLQAAEMLQAAKDTGQLGAFFTRARRLFACGLKPALDEEAAGDLIDELGGIGPATKLLGDALGQALDGLTEEAPADPRPASKKTRSART